jgi:hypothetical protein
MDQFRDYKRMKVGDKKWAKVDKLIRDDDTKLVLFEVPKGVSILRRLTMCDYIV